jgi:hypothetical protein
MNSSMYTEADSAEDIQHSRHSGRKTMANIYTIPDINPDVHYQLRIQIHHGGLTN